MMQLKEIVNLKVLFISVKLVMSFCSKVTAGQIKSDDTIRLKTLLFLVLLHITIFKLLYLMKFNWAVHRFIQSNQKTSSPPLFIK